MVIFRPGQWQVLDFHSTDNAEQCQDAARKRYIDGRWVTQLPKLCIGNAQQAFHDRKLVSSSSLVRSPNRVIGLVLRSARTLFGNQGYREHPTSKYRYEQEAQNTSAHKFNEKVRRTLTPGFRPRQEVLRIHIVRPKLKGMQYRGPLTSGMADV